MLIYCFVEVEKMKKLLILMLLLGVAGSAWASNDWLQTNTSNDWFEPTNWSLGVVPSLTDAVNTNVRTFQTHCGAPIIIDSGDAGAWALEIGGDSQALIPGNIQTITLNGGTITTVDYFRVGASSSSNRWGAFYMNDGVVNVGGYMAVCRGGSGTNTHGYVYMTGGEINVAGDLYIPHSAPGSGEIYISGGTITVGGLLQMRYQGTTVVNEDNPTTVLDITGSGKVILAGDQVDAVLEYRDNGWIVTGGEEFLDEYVTFDGTNTILQIPEPATLCILAIGAFGLIRRK
jgi:hypothetical protein